MPIPNKIRSFTGNVSSGTTSKFVPVIASDTRRMNGREQNVNTKHICISAMWCYQGISLEVYSIIAYLHNFYQYIIQELRIADYNAGRKQQPFLSDVIMNEIFILLINFTQLSDTSANQNSETTYLPGILPRPNPILSLDCEICSLNRLIRGVMRARECNLVLSCCRVGR